MRKRFWIIGGLLLVLLIATGVYYFVLKPNGDKELLDNLETKIEAVENNITENETTDQAISTEVNADLSEDEETLEELDAELDSILDSLSDIESTETELGSTVE